MMIYVCLWSPRWATDGELLDELAAALLEVVPRLAMDGRGVVWADARGLPAREIARELVARAGSGGGSGGEVRAGVSAVPITAELAARYSATAPSIAAHAEIQEAGEQTSRGGQASPVFPAQAGTQSVAGGTKDWVPACAGMTERAAGITERAAVRTQGAAAAEGIAGVPESNVLLVPPGSERHFLAPLPLDLLAPDPRLLALLTGVGLRTCGDLAALSREAVEVRFGVQAGALWRLARADDRRILFRPVPRERPHASMDFLEYEVREAGHLVFTVNALLGSVCETLDSRGERARSMTLALALSSGGSKRERLRSARPTADREVWIRRLQELLDRLRLPEPVVGVSLEVDETEPRSATQGDLFDLGFATASAVEEAVARLLDEQGPVLGAPEMDGHPLAERRIRWVARTAEDVAGLSGGSRGRRSRSAAGGRAGAVPATPSPSSSGQRTSRPDIMPAEEAPGLISDADVAPDLALQLLREPRPLGVRIAFQGVQILPQSYKYAGAWHGVAVAAGPDRLSGGRWGAAPFARDYFRCLTEEGRLVWIYRDLDENRWYLHGWWE